MTTGWKNYGYGDRVVVIERDHWTIMDGPERGEVVGQGRKPGRLRVKLDAGQTIEVYPEQMRHEN